MRWLREAATLTDNDARLPFMPQVLGELAHAAALAGDLDVAQAALEAAKRYTADAARLFHLWVALAKPWEAAARGERSTAVALAIELAEQARSRGQVTFQLQALHDVARLGEPSRVSRCLHEASAGVEGQLAPLYVAHADALSSHDAVALDRVASGFAGLGLNLLAAEAQPKRQGTIKQPDGDPRPSPPQSKPTRSPRNAKAPAPPPWTHARHTTSPPAN
jgi:hypothetical protein